MRLQNFFFHLVEIKGNSMYQFIPFIDFKSISKDTLTKFFTFSDDIDKSLILQCLQNSRERKHTITTLDETILSREPMIFEFNEKRPFDGIFHYLSPKIQVRVSSCHSNYFSPWNVLDFESEHNCWYSGPEPDQWIFFDISPNLISPSYYSIRTSGASPYSGHIRSWCFYGSINLVNWTLIDERKREFELNGISREKTYPCQTKEFFQFFKMIQTETNHRGDYTFTLSVFELFGQLFSNKH